MQQARTTFLASLAAWGITSVVWLPISPRARADVLGALPKASGESDALGDQGALSQQQAAGQLKSAVNG